LPRNSRLYRNPAPSGRRLCHALPARGYWQSSARASGLSRSIWLIERRRIRPWSLKMRRMRDTVSKVSPR